MSFTTTSVGHTLVYGNDLRAPLGHMVDTGLCIEEKPCGVRFADDLARIREFLKG